MSRYNFNLNGETEAAFKHFIAETGSKAGAFLRIISIAAFIDKTLLSGDKIIVEDKDGSMNYINWENLSKSQEEKKYSE
jgi:hypothetical protein